MPGDHAGTCTEEKITVHCPRCSHDTPHLIHACRDQKTSRCTECGYTERYLEH